MASQNHPDVGRRVGELAAAAGLTVRTLHHYDDIGLLKPSGRSEGGHRLYVAADVQRLYRVCLLRRLGLSLTEIGHALDDPAWSLRGAMARHLDQLDERIAASGRLRSHLSRLLATVGDRDVPLTDDLLNLMEEMTMLDTAVQRRISILVYDDMAAAYEYLTDVFGLTGGQVTRDDEDNIVHAELQAGDGVVWLHPSSEQFGLASPRSVGAATASMAVMVDDVDAHHEHAASKGAEILYEPVDQPYGYREYSVRDPEGGFWSFMKPLD